MHRLQQHILGQLIHNSRLRYSDLKPKEVEGNLFMYHLRLLLNQELVTKCEDGSYELSASGQAYADGLSLKTLTPRAQPRIVTLMIITNERGGYLLYRRKRQPLLGMIGFPYGKLHLGETIASAASRELKEKTGLTAELVHRGDGYATIYQHNQVVSQTFFHVFIGKNPTGKLRRSTNAGTAFWGDVNETYNLMPTVSDLIKLLGQNPDKRFFCELSYK